MNQTIVQDFQAYRDDANNKMDGVLNTIQDITASQGHSVFPREQADYDNRTLFLDGDNNIARYDNEKTMCRYLRNIIALQQAFDWKPEEIDLIRDRVDFQAMPESLRHMFLYNLRYQTLLDSVQGRSPVMAFLTSTSIPELETWVVAWTYSETIHSRSYTHIIKNIIEAAEVDEEFNSIVIDKRILERAGSVSDDYDRLISYTEMYRLLGEGVHTINGKTVELNKYTLIRLIIRALAAANVLEGIRFYVSFACTFNFQENGMMSGSASIMKLIARDESLHFAVASRILLDMKNGVEGEVFEQAFADELPNIMQMTESAVKQEMDWADFLCSKGDILGMTAERLKQFVRYRANIFTNALELGDLYPNTDNPFGWFNKYIDSNEIRVAAQEHDMTYVNNTQNTTTESGQQKIDQGLDDI